MKAGPPKKSAIAAEGTQNEADLSFVSWTRNPWAPFCTQNRHPCPARTTKSRVSLISVASYGVSCCTRRRGEEGWGGDLLDWPLGAPLKPRRYSSGRFHWGGVGVVSDVKYS